MIQGHRVSYCCPDDKSPLQAVSDPQTSGNAGERGYLLSQSGQRFAIEDGIVDFIRDSQIIGGDSDSIAEYDRAAAVYDTNLPVTFATICHDEAQGRNKIIEKLNLRPGNTVLEVGCGTGRDTELIASALEGRGRIYAQDLSFEILKMCKAKFANSPLAMEFARANASAIPLPDDTCDAVFHFGGLNTFTELSKAIREMCRVTREGGRVVVGDESVAPWMRQSELGRVLMHNNPLYAHLPPLDLLPAEARDVAVQWVFAGTFYVISFDVSKKPLPYDLDIAIPGTRGGTHRTRYYGQLEGVTAEARQLAVTAAAAAGKSLHDWLESAVRAAAKQEIQRGGPHRPMVAGSASRAPGMG